MLSEKTQLRCEDYCKLLGSDGEGRWRERWVELLQGEERLNGELGTGAGLLRACGACRREVRGGRRDGTGRDETREGV